MTAQGSAPSLHDWCVAQRRLGVEFDETNPAVDAYIAAFTEHERANTSAPALIPVRLLDRPSGFVEPGEASIQPVATHHAHEGDAVELRQLHLAGWPPVHAQHPHGLEAERPGRPHAPGEARRVVAHPPTVDEHTFGQRRGVA